MRKNRENQLPLTPLWPDHQLSYELQMISRILDDNPEILDLVLQDLSDKTDPQKGSPGLSAEQVLRCAVLKTWQQLSYQKLAFHLADSISLRGFCRLPWGWTPCKSCLQDNISRIRASSWEKINRVLIRWAAGEGLEKGKKIRVDATAVESDIHHPTDSQLLYDSIRKLTALLGKLKEHHPVVYSDHCRRAKRRCTNIRNTRGQDRKKPLYQDLLKVAGQTAHYARVALQSASQWKDIPSLVIVDKLRHYLELMHKVREQTERRVLQDKKVPAADKVVSIFEEHTDIIQTGGRETTFGHKVFLTCGKTSLMLDCRVVRGNPADQAQMKTMLKRHCQLYGHYPRQASFDGGFATQGNLGLGQGTRNPRRGLCQEGSTESLRDGAFQLGLSAVAAFPSWNRGLHLDAQASLRCRSLHLEGLGAFSAVPASFGSQLQPAGPGSTSPVGSSSSLAEAS